MPSNLGTFPDCWIFGKVPKLPWNFPRCLVIWEISNIFDKEPPQISIGIWVIWESSQITQISQTVGKVPKLPWNFPRLLDVWESSQITVELSQMPGILGNFQYF